MRAATRVAFVTGAAQGIGLATVNRLARDGWRVLGLDRQAKTLSFSMAALQDQGLDVTAAVCDICDRDAGTSVLDVQPRVDAVVCRREDELGSGAAFEVSGAEAISRLRPRPVWQRARRIPT